MYLGFFSLLYDIKAALRFSYFYMERTDIIWQPSEKEVLLIKSECLAVQTSTAKKS